MRTSVSLSDGLLIRRFLLALALLPFTTVGWAVEASGTSAGGTTFAPYPVNGVPVLDSFRLEYVYTDHHVQTLMIQPASLVPNPTPASPTVPAGQIALALEDVNGDDDYRYYVQHAAVGQGVFRNRIASSCVLACTVWLNRPSSTHVFALVGFKLRFTKGDRHIRRVALIERNGVLTVAFRDQWPDVPFTYELEYVYLPASAVALTGTVSGGQSVGTGPRGSDSRTINLGPRGTGATIIRGFDFEFWADVDFGSVEDHHLRSIGVMTPGNFIDVTFRDQNGDDPIKWTVDWAALALPGPYGTDPINPFPRAP
jgi:hypothetical protein